MRERVFSFPGRGAGSRHDVLTLSYGDPAARPHVHVQGGLHADEGPGMMAARLLADRLMVMKSGRVVEQGLTDQVLDDPQHAYTQLLVSSVLQV